MTARPARLREWSDSGDEKRGTKVPGLLMEIESNVDLVTRDLSPFCDSNCPLSSLPWLLVRSFHFPFGQRNKPLLSVDGEIVSGYILN